MWTRKKFREAVVFVLQAHVIIINEWVHFTLKIIELWCIGENPPSHRQMNEQSAGSKSFPERSSFSILRGSLGFSIPANGSGDAMPQYDIFRRTRFELRTASSSCKHAALQSLKFALRSRLCRHTAESKYLREGCN